MIKVKLMSNTARVERIIDESTVIREFLDAEGFNYSIGTMNLNGQSLSRAELENAFADYNVGETCNLINVAKSDAG
jgi:hypothetical protein